ncbi:hypothetical protein EG329_000529 [Mollisiaceae sp. DMI_Dod_QoI]|nr:hypothetical protein EG329_000529 [Helotiales sp. DMI_Dod_QoI]
MASWKEKGEVPDSDDEWDIESQSIEQDGGADGLGLETSLDDEKDVDLGNEERISSQDFAGKHSEGLQQQTSAINKASQPGGQDAATTLNSKAVGLYGQVWSSPDSRKAFTVPDLECLSNDEVFYPRIDTRRPSPTHELPAVDDISRSYVRITSPLSTPLSSPPGSQPELPPLRRSKSGSIISPSSRAVEAAAPEHDKHEREQDLNGRSSYPMKRALRQRNAIQLHPYVVEQEKYRRTLKARGIAPTRLASSQIEERHAPRNSLSPDPEFQEQETQEVEGDTGESQTMDFEWNPLPSSSPVPPAGNQNDNNGIHQNKDQDEEEEEEEEEDLPDIEELLRSRHQIPSNKGPQRRRIKSYSHKFKHHVLPRIFTQPRKSNQIGGSYGRTLDIPASPPTTSSPLSNAFHSGRPGTSGGASGSLEPSPSFPNQDEIRLRTTIDLPTPATSAIKPPMGTISLDSDSESDDPFASDVENAVIASSSDESVQIRKISKKFRGVLPASHLRLDQQKKQPSLNRTNRESRSVSPIKMIPRRGIALPRTQSVIRGVEKRPSAPTNTTFAFFSDDDVENNENESSGFIIEDDPASQLESLFTESRMGYAEEEDKIDAMLPSRKRHSTTSSRPLKKRKIGSAYFPRMETETHKRQPKITKHLGRVFDAPSSGRSKLHRQRKGKERKNSSKLGRPPLPELSILDVAGIFTDSQGTSPDFIRIAARAARSRSAQGRHRPAGKFFRLSTREDTEDVQSVLQDWTAGKLHPLNLPSLNERITQASRGPLHQIPNNQQSYFEAPTIGNKPTVPINHNGSSRKVRKLLISKRQQSMNNFVRKDQMQREPSNPTMQHQASTNIDLGSKRRPRLAHHSARPAQLEAAEKDYSSRYPSTTFKSSKRALDAFYRGARKRPLPSANLQLSRFLADEDVVRPSVETSSSGEQEVFQDATNNPTRSVPMRLGRQKRRPQRFDVGAAIYRQPSDPLILDCSATGVVTDAFDGDKLVGLAKFGTRYPQHFDILPLPPGVFFHVSTFIGRGRLSEVIRNVRVEHPSPTHIDVSLSVTETFSWGLWDASVSSEIGLCFDWLVDQLQLDGPTSSNPPGIAAMDIVISILDYIQQSLTFSGPFNEMMFLSRMLEVIQDFSRRLKINKIVDQGNAQNGIQILSRLCVLAFHLLSMARAQQDYTTLSFEFEDALKCTACQCAQLLLSQDLSLLRKLYDDLQYLSFRDSGIRNDQYAAEAWVILIKVLGAAHLSRGSFWDVIDPLLTAVDITKITDAPAMEKVWYSMYTFLPLCEFDEYGVVIQEARQATLFDNWQLPQHLLKRIFSIYKSNPRQPPGFNDYCRSLVSRCHYLMVEWGWWKCTAIIGTLFDFFASHNLAHLRNEEVYTSPPFLEELDQNPSLAVEPEDRCFHIFLKIVALALKHFARANDLKSVRNLVARLLPNHDRQYPKDEGIHQRDLASLRNHHDLLCTLFWASPPSQRPPTTIIEQLVERGGSHKEAFLVHIRARGQISRFVLSENCDSETYKPLKDWHNLDMDCLISQYTSAEGEARNQAGEGVTEAQIKEIVSRNKDQILSQILTLLAVLRHDIEVTTSAKMAMRAYDSGLLIKTLDCIIHDDKSLLNGLLCQCLKIIDTYIRKVVDLRPTPVPQVAVNAGGGDDSQESWDESDLYMIDVLATLEDVHGKLALLVRECLKRDAKVVDVLSMQYLIGTWARLATLFVDAGTQDAKKYLICGEHAVFDNRETCKAAQKYWPCFLANMLKLGNVKISGFNIELEWLLVLIDPDSCNEFETDLTTQMAAKGSYLCKIVDRQASAVVRLKGAISTMNMILARNTARSDVGLPYREVQSMFSEMLGSIEDSMQQNLKTMQPRSQEHQNYLQKVWEIAAHIKAFASDFRRLSPYFTNPSVHYWPDEMDPLQFVPTLISYCLRLEREPEKCSSELFYFLYYRWQAHVRSGRINIFQGHLKQCMKYLSFVKFLLADFIPVTLQAAFETDTWPLCYHFLPAIVSRVKRILRYKERVDDSTSGDDWVHRQQTADWVFAKVVNIFKIFLNNITNPRIPMGTIIVFLEFWYSIAFSLRVYAKYQSEHEKQVVPVGVQLNRYVLYLRDKGKFTQPTFPARKSEFLNRERVLDDLVESTEKMWESSMIDGRVSVKSKDGDDSLELPVTLDNIINYCPGSIDVWFFDEEAE